MVVSFPYITSEAKFPLFLLSQTCQGLLLWRIFTEIGKEELSLFRGQHPHSFGEPLVPPAANQCVQMGVAIFCQPVPVIAPVTDQKAGLGSSHPASHVHDWSGEGRMTPESRSLSWRFCPSIVNYL